LEPFIRACLPREKVRCHVIAKPLCCENPARFVPWTLEEPLERLRLEGLSLR
jgi:hypothetical protein